MRSFGFMAAGIILLGGLNASMAASTYCEFQDLNPSLCSSNVISATVTAANKKIAVTLTSSVALDYTGYSFEAVISSSKILDDLALNAKSGASNLLIHGVVSVTVPGTTSLSLTIPAESGMPYYLFYRLRHTSGNAILSTPWKVYGTAGTPTTLCAETSCNPEVISIKTGDSQWLTRLTFDQTTASNYSLTTSDGTTAIDASKCSTTPSYSSLESSNYSCYKLNGRIVVLSYSSIAPVLNKAITSTLSTNTQINAINSTAGMRIQVLLAGISGSTPRADLAAIIDKAASVDGLSDVFADLNIRYADLTSLANILAADNTDGTGTQGRNKGWLYPQFNVLMKTQKCDIIFSKIWKKAPNFLYYAGTIMSNYGADALARDDIKIPIVTKDGLHAYLRNVDGSMYDISTYYMSLPSIDSELVMLRSGSDDFANFSSGGLWFGFPDNNYGPGTISMFGRTISTVDIAKGASLLNEVYDYRKNNFNSDIGSKYDVLLSANTGDTINIHAGTKKKFLVDGTIVSDPTGISVTYDKINSQTTRGGITAVSVADDGSLALTVDDEASKGLRFYDLLEVPSKDGQDKIIFPMEGRILSGVHYIVMGYSQEYADRYIRRSISAAEYFAKDRISKGEEVHIISALTRSYDKARWFQFNEPRRTTISTILIDGKSVTITKDYWGLSSDQIKSCLDGVPYSAYAAGYSAECGTPNITKPENISGLTYFGHGSDGELLNIGLASVRTPYYTTWDKCKIGDALDVNGGIATKCWYNTNTNSQITLKSDDPLSGVSKALFAKDATFTAYACDAAYDNGRGDGNVISRLSNAWGIKAKGDGQKIAIACLGPSNSNEDGLCSFGELKYYNPNLSTMAKDKSYYVKLNALMDNDHPGCMRDDLSIWRRLKFDVCSSSGCIKESELVTPDFFNVGYMK
jgi:hypothetical protein